MRTLLLISLLFPFTTFSQFTKVQKRKKEVIKYGERDLIKVKADSIFLSEDIATIYKKSNVFYIDSSGTKLFKTKTENGLPFQNGFAIIRNEFGKYGAINSKGKQVVPFEGTQPGTYFGNLLLSTISYPPNETKNLYYSSGPFFKDIDSVSWLHNWIVVTYTREEKVTSYQKRLLRKPKAVTVDKIVVHNTVFDPYTYEELSTDNFVDYADFVFFGTSKKRGNLISIDKTFRMDSIQQLEAIDSAYFKIQKNNQLNLFNRKNNQIVLNGNFTDFKLNKSTVFGVSSYEVNDYPHITIFEYNGNKLNDELELIRDLDRDRFIFQENGLQFIGNEKGDTLSSKYFLFGEYYNDKYRVVYSTTTYSYINDFTYQKLPIEYPILRVERISPARKLGGFLKAMAQMTESLIRVMTLQKPKHYSSSSSSSTNTSLVGANPFNDGWAKVCLYGLNKDNQYDSILNVTSYNYRPFNYVDTTGKLMNKLKYDYASEFNNGTAWVSYKGNYYFINASGDKVNQKKYERIREIGNGYFEGRKNWVYYIISPELKEVASYKEGILHEAADGFYLSNGEEKKLLYGFPTQVR